MNFTPEDTHDPSAQHSQEIIQEWSRRQVRQLLPVIPIGLLILLLLTGENLQAYGHIIGPSVAGVVLWTAVFTYRNWRCPSCNFFMGENPAPRFCEHCGVRLSKN